jgi:hypothetical protein
MFLFGCRAKKKVLNTEVIELKLINEIANNERNVGESPTWDIINNGIEKEKFYYSMEDDYMYCKYDFSDNVKELVGKKILLEGYVHHVTNSNSVIKEIFLSRYLSQGNMLCIQEFGVHDVVLIKFTKAYPFEVSSFCKIEGIFKIDTTDVKNLPFQLLDAECLTCE